MFPHARTKKDMSLTQTYHLAHMARGKLSKEAARDEHRLYRLVGHANLLDSLMLDLQAAEEEQERWFNATVKSVVTTAAAPVRLAEPKIQWADTPARVDEADEDSDDFEYSEDLFESSDDEDYADLDRAMDDDFAPLARVTSHSDNLTPQTIPTASSSSSSSSENSYADLALSSPSVPELESDDDSDIDDDEDMPRSPELPAPLEHLPEKEEGDLGHAGSVLFPQSSDYANDAFFSPAIAPAISVY